MLSELICIISCHAGKIAKSLKSSRRTKVISARCFYIFLQRNILLEEFQQIFQWSGLDLSNINQERKSTFDQFQKAVKRVFLNKLCRTSEKTNIKIEMLFIHLTYHTVSKYKSSFAACGVIRGPSYSTMSQGVKKKAFCSFDF